MWLKKKKNLLQRCTNSRCSIFEYIFMFLGTVGIYYVLWIQLSNEAYNRFWCLLKSCHSKESLVLVLTFNVVWPTKCNIKYNMRTYVSYYYILRACYKYINNIKYCEHTLITATLIFIKFIINFFSF